MTPASKSMLPLLALVALTGCEILPVYPNPQPPPPGQAPTEVQFNVTAPPETPVDATLLLLGSHAALRGESGQGLALVYQGGEQFSARARLPQGTAFTYRLALWRPADTQVALDDTGAVLPEQAFTTTELLQQTVEATVPRWGPESGAAASPQLVFVAQVPEATPPEASLWLSGNHALLGSGSAAGARLYKALGNRHAVQLSFPAGTSLEFKATRGSWETVETGAGGEPLPHRTHTTQEGFERLSFTIARWADLGGASPPPASE